MSEFTNATGLSVGELKKLVSTAKSCEGHIKSPSEANMNSGAGVPIGRIINDIGFHFINKEAGAEELLAGLLTDERRDAHFCAYAYLITDRNSVSVETEGLLVKFETDPAMAETVELAQEHARQRATG